MGPVGYGVEIAVLIDALRRHGLDALAECHLGERQNRHQPLRALGEMAYGVLAAVETRIGGGRSAVGGHYLRPWDDYAVAQVAVTERPPLATLGSASARVTALTWQATPTSTERSRLSPPRSKSPLADKLQLLGAPADDDARLGDTDQHSDA